MRIPKILHTTTRLVRGGGVENNIYHSINKLYGEYEFHLASGVDFQHNPFADKKDVKIIICKDLINTISPLKDFKALLFFYRLIKKEKYDIVHTHETKASFITKLAAWMAGCPVVIYGLHGVTFNDPMSSAKRNFYIFLEKVTIGVSDLIISVSHDVMKHYHANNIGVKIPYYIVRSGIDLEEFKSKSSLDHSKKEALRNSLSIAPNELTLINVGRFSYSKAQRYTIEAFASIHKELPNTKLILVGEGELIDECKSLAQSLNIENAIVFTGYREDVMHLLSISDLFLFTSLREGLPRVTVEAHLLELPVVAFDVEGIKEVVIEGESGYIVAQYDINGLITKTLHILKDTSRIKQFGKAGHENVKYQWDANIMGNKLREIYNKHIQNK